MVASIRADGRQRKKKSSKQAGKIHSESEKTRCKFLSDNHGLYPADSAKRIRHRKGSKGLAKATSQTFPFDFDYLWENPL